MMDPTSYTARLGSAYANAERGELLARIATLETELRAALTYIAESPCDPDITRDQWLAWVNLLGTLGCHPAAWLARNTPTDSEKSS